MVSVCSLEPECRVLHLTHLPRSPHCRCSFSHIYILHICQPSHPALLEQIKHTVSERWAKTHCSHVTRAKSLQQTFQTSLQDPISLWPTLLSRWNFGCHCRDPEASKHEIPQVPAHLISFLQISEKAALALFDVNCSVHTPELIPSYLFNSTAQVILPLMYPPCFLLCLHRPNQVEMSCLNPFPPTMNHPHLLTTTFFERTQLHTVTIHYTPTSSPTIVFNSFKPFFALARVKNDYDLFIKYV